MVAWNPTANFFTNDEAISLVERLFHVAQKFETNNFRGRLELLPVRQTKSRSEGFSESQIFCSKRLFQKNACWLEMELHSWRLGSGANLLSLINLKP